MSKISKRAVISTAAALFAVVAVSGLLGGIIVGSAGAQSVDTGACTCPPGNSMIAGRCVERAR